jgi:branched-chain amino acid transport system ATP-binding protein
MPIWVKKNMLEVKSIHVFYRDLYVVKDISLSVKEGKIVSILGSNGAGKTTLLKAVSGFVPVAKGEITFKNKEISKLKPYELVRQGIVLVPEGRRIFNRMKVIENLELGAYSYYGRKNMHEIKRRIEEIHHLFPILKGRRNQIAGSLSGGEQQMLAIGRALMSMPSLLLLDEPSVGLAPLVTREIFTNINRLSDTGVTMLLVEQNARAALKISTYVYVLGTGVVVTEGTPEELLQDEKIKQAYLG